MLFIWYEATTTHANLFDSCAVFRYVPLTYCIGSISALFARIRENNRGAQWCQAITDTCVDCGREECPASQLKKIEAKHRAY